MMGKFAFLALFCTLEFLFFYFSFLIVWYLANIQKILKHKYFWLGRESEKDIEVKKEWMVVTGE